MFKVKDLKLYVICHFLKKAADQSFSGPFCRCYILQCLPLCLTILLTHFAYLINHHTKPYSKLGCSENLVILVCSIFLTGEDPPKPETSDHFTFCRWHNLSSSLVKGQGSTSINPVDNIHQAALAQQKWKKSIQSMEKR